MLIEALRLQERSVDITAAPVSLAPQFARLCRDNENFANGNGARVGCCRRGALMKVYDTGMGIPSEKLSTVFEAFHRLDPTRTDGLGLRLFWPRSPTAPRAGAHERICRPSANRELTSSPP
jgi:signal transduction histidine kinase